MAKITNGAQQSNPRQTGGHGQESAPSQGWHASETGRELETSRQRPEGGSRGMGPVRPHAFEGNPSVQTTCEACGLGDSNPVHRSDDRL